MKTRIDFTSHPRPDPLPHLVWLWHTRGPSQHERLSHLVLLCPAVLDQVSRVVHLAGVAPAFWWRISERHNKNKAGHDSPRVLWKPMWFRSQGGGQPAVPPWGTRSLVPSSTKKARKEQQLLTPRANRREQSGHESAGSSSSVEPPTIDTDTCPV